MRDEDTRRSSDTRPSPERLVEHDLAGILGSQPSSPTTAQDGDRSSDRARGPERHGPAREIGGPDEISPDAGPGTDSERDRVPASREPRDVEAGVPGADIAATQAGEAPQATPAAASSADGLVIFEPIIIQPPIIFPPFIPLLSDPLFDQQLHLVNPNAGQFDLNVQDVWADYSGDGIHITVIDSRVDITHPDYDANYDTATDWDYISGDGVPGSDLSNGERHGTAVIGIIAGERFNQIGGRGVAFEATVRNYGGLAFADLDEQIEDAAGRGDGIGNIHGDGDGSDIVSMSFGLNVAPARSPTTNNTFNNDLSTGDLDDVQAVEGRLADASANGRGGLGTIYVKSAGNSRGAADTEGREESTADFLDTSKYTIIVGATRWDGWIDNTSTPGANLLVVAPTDDLNSASAVVTTDLQGTSGYNTATTANGGDYTTTFGGTSSAAPMVSGVVALMLEANPDLGWRDVQNILAYSARHVGSAVGSNANTGAPVGGGFEQATVSGDSWFWNGATDWNGGSLHFSNDYGFGLIDAKAAVRLAETWRGQKTSANDTSASQDMDGTNVTTTYGSAFVSHTATETTNLLIEHVNLNVDFSTIDDMSDLEIFVTSPDGTRVQAIADTGGAQSIGTGNTGFTAGGGFDWTFGIQAFRGEESAGTWTVQIRNDDGSANGAIVSTDVDLFFYGSPITDNDLFILTHEFSDYAGGANHSTNIAGGAGTDIINAAAVDTASTINLLANSGTVDGVSFTNSSIEIVYTGDGNDTITGDAFSRELHGGRGNDRINSGSASETLYGGGGADTLTLGSGDKAYGGLGNDSFELGSGTFTDVSIYGEAGSDRLLVTATSGAAEFDDVSNQISSIEEIEFGASGIGKLLRISAQELDQSNEVSSTLRIDGSGAAAADELEINWIGSITSTIDWSGWIFQDWNDAQDLIDINMDATSSTLQATSRAEEIDAGGGNDTVYGGGGNDEILGGRGEDVAYGGEGDDQLLGQTGNDTLHGDAGNDTLQGGSSNDVLYGGTEDDTFKLGTEGGTDSVYGGSGKDTLDLDTFGSTGWDFGYTTSGTRVSQSGQAALPGFVSIEVLIATRFDDLINEEGTLDEIYAGGGNDTVTGILNSVDSFYGGTGIDTYDLSTETLGLDIDLEAGTLGGDGVLDGFENVIAGSGNDTITGESGVANSLGGMAGEDILYGGDGDTLDGGAGNDTFFVAEDGGSSTISGGRGVDTLDVSSWSAGITLLGGSSGDLVGGIPETIISGANGSGLERLIATDFDDVINEYFIDRIEAGGGNDTVRTNGTNTATETFDGGRGVDLIDFSLAPASFNIEINLESGLFTGSGGATNFENVIANDGDNVITTVGAEANNIDGRGGADTISSGGGNDSVLGGAGNDTIDGGADDDTLGGGLGDDKLRGADGGDRLEGGAGADNIGGGNQGDVLYGGRGNDRLFGNGGADSIFGEDGADVIFGNNGWDVLHGNSGKDRIFGGNGGDKLYGGGSKDQIFGGKGNDTAGGGNGDDKLRGADGADRLKGGAGADNIGGGNRGDVLYGGRGNDRLFGNGGADSIFGEGGADVIFGDNGWDVLHGNSGDDRIYGGKGGDSIRGGSGDDVIEGGKGPDTLQGDGGADTFVWRKFQSGVRDVVTDFDPATDRLVLDLWRRADLDDLVIRDHPMGSVVVVKGAAILFRGLEPDDLLQADIDFI